MRGEAWLTERLQRAEPLTFPAEWPEADRSVSGDFVLELVLDPRWATAPDGLVLANATVTTPIRRRYVDIGGEACFDGCVFQAEVALIGATSHKRVRFLGCRFEQDLDLEGSRLPEVDLGTGASGRATEFHGDVGFRSVEIAGALAADGVSVVGDADFVGARLGTVSFERATFHAMVDFGTAHVSDQMSFERARFGGGADFVGLRAMGYTTFERARFRGQVDLSYADIRGPLLFNRARFRRALDFEGAVLSDAYFDRAVFVGPLRCGRGEIKGQLSLEKTTIHGAADFNAIRVGGALYLRRTRFRRGLDFGSGVVGGQIVADGVVFEGKVDFNGATVGDLFLTGARFGAAAVFCGLKASGQVIADGANFAAGVDFSGTEARDVFLDMATFAGLADFSLSTVAARFSLVGAEFKSSLGIANTSIAGTFEVFSGGRPERAAPPAEAFTESGVQSVARPTGLPCHVDLRGLTYGRTDLETSDRTSEWLSLCGQPDRHEPDPFLTLERACRKAGHEERADWVHYRMRKAEARYLLRQLRERRGGVGVLVKLLWNWLLMVTVGYGVYGERLLYWTVGTLAVNSLVVWVSGDAAFQRASTAPTTAFLPIWYALDVLIPVDLGQEKHWRPVGTGMARWVAMQGLLGWVLLPLVLAQIAGLLKKRGS